MIPSSFYHEHLTGVAIGLQSVGTFLKIVGVNDLDDLIEGYLYVPITIFGQTIMASFLVKSDTLNDYVGRRVKSPVILGCNVLRAIAENSMEPMGPSREDWRLALRWIQLVSEPESGSSEGLTTVDTTLSVPISHNADACAVIILGAETREAVSIHHGEVTVLQCRVSIDNASLEGRPMLVQALYTTDAPLHDRGDSANQRWSR